MSSYITLAQQTVPGGAKPVQAAPKQTQATVQVQANGAAPEQEGPRSFIDGLGSMAPMLIIMAVKNWAM